MKIKFPLIIASLIISFNGFSQSFAPVGAKWTYELIVARPTFIKTYTTLEVEKDTVFMGKTVRKLKAYNLPSYNYFSPYIYQSGDTIYFYNDYIQNFSVLYIFNLNIGEGWQTVYKLHDNRIDSVTCTISAINNYTLHGISKKRYQIKWESKYTPGYWHSEQFTDQETFYYYINEFFGAEKFHLFSNLLHSYYVTQDSSMSLDSSTSAPIRCYSDTIIGSFNFTDKACDYIYTVSSPNFEKLAFHLFPNPTTDFIHLQLENTENVHYRITDITGKVIAQNAWNGQTISVENLNSGVYFITLLNKNEIVGTQKIVKR